MFKKFFYLILLGTFICLTSYYAPTLLANSNLSNTKIDWWLVRGKNHQTPGFNDKLSFKLSDYDAICLGDT